MARTPILGGTIGATFPLQFTASGVSSLSMAVTLIEQFSNDGQDTVLSHGSGCFWRHEGRTFLLTARHVVSGRHPFDDGILSRDGFIPRRFGVYPSIEGLPGQFIRAKYVFEFNQNLETPWLQDPEFETLRTDIAAVSLDLPANVRCLNDSQEIFEDVFTQVGMDCAIVGYPNIHFEGPMTPIWRRGTIASEPFYPMDGKPMFLLDASTSPGFSGAPVFRRHYGALPVEQPDGSYHILADRIVTTSFVGIYAGRLEHRHFGGEVPFVFYGNRVPIILAGAGR